MQQKKIILLAFCFGHAAVVSAFTTQFSFLGCIQFRRNARFGQTGTVCRSLRHFCESIKCGNNLKLSEALSATLVISECAHVILINVNRNLTCIRPHCLFNCHMLWEKSPLSSSQNLTEEGLTVSKRCVPDLLQNTQRIPLNYQSLPFLCKLLPFFNISDIKKKKGVIKSNNASNEEFMFRSIWSYTHVTFF